MQCEDVETVVADHLTGRLTVPAATALAEHLRACQACADDLHALEETWHQLGRLPGAAFDASRMRTRFDAALHDEMTRLSPRPRRIGGHHVLQLLAAAVLLALGVLIGRETRPASNPELGQMRAALRDMREMVSLSLLQQQSAGERLKGVTWTSRIDQPGDEVTNALLDALMHDPNVNVRLASIDALKRFAGRDAVRRGAIGALPRQTSPLVQIALIDFVRDLNERDGIAALRRLSHEPMLDDAVRARAAQAAAHAG